MSGFRERRRGERGGHAPGRRRISVAVALQAHLDREGLLALLGSQPDLRAVGGAADLPGALALCLARRPRVLLLSTLLGGPPDAPTPAVIRLAVPETRIVAIAPHGADRCALLNPTASPAGDGGQRLRDEHGTCIEFALAYGAVRAVNRDASPEDLFRAIRAAAGGPPWAAADVPLNHPAANHLTQQEGRVAWLVGQGGSNKEIAAALRISGLTVKKHIGHVLDKLGLHDRLQLGLLVARHPLSFREGDPAAARFFKAPATRTRARLPARTPRAALRPLLDVRRGGQG
jgi:DNA-binding NarL/FixJ family response regulator